MTCPNRLRIAAVVPARGGSKGVLGKNIRPICGKPLIGWTLDAALAATSLDRIIVSTEDEGIAAVAAGYGVEVAMRPAALAADDSPTLAALQHVMAMLAEKEGYRPDAVMTLQPTSPLRTARHIDEAAALFVADEDADSLVSCIAVPHIFHPRSIMRRDEAGYLRPYMDSVGPTRRQEKEPVFARNGAAVYITRIDRIAEYVFGGNLLAYMMDETASIDIDDENDFRCAEEALMRQRRG
jgi:CMP-N,N'-diacetyllegionaminic acid synthase